MSGEHVLVVEDDGAILAGLEAKLELEGYRVTLARDGEIARQFLTDADPDVIVLDIMLPEIDGLSLLRWYRKRGARTPVLILSARGREEQKVEGLKAGADDYLAKPFGARELVARVEALLRRANTVDDRVMIGDNTVDLERGTVGRGDEIVELSPKELSLLRFFLRRPGQVLSRERIHASVWGDGSSDPRAVDYHVLHLRKKLESDPKKPKIIVTHHGRGYELLR